MDKMSYSMAESPAMATMHLYEFLFPNGKRYLGITTNPTKRWQLHKDHARKGSQHLVHRAIRHHGWDAVQRRVLVIGEKAYIRQLESAAIAAFNTMDPAVGYNMTPGGEINPMDTPAVREKMRKSLTGRKESPETCAKKKASWTPERRAAAGAWLAAARKANAKGRKPKPKKQGPHGNCGAVRSPEMRAKIAASLRGRKMSQERLAQIKATANSDEVRTKMRASAQRRWQREKNE